jgi:hypothetical protein
VTSLSSESDSPLRSDDGEERLGLARMLAAQIKQRRFGESSEDEVDPNLQVGD